MYSSTSKSQKDSQIEPAKEEQYLTLNQALEQLEQNPRYQNQVLYVLALINMIFAFFIMGLPFLFATPNFLCGQDETTAKYCIEPEACSAPYYKLDPNSFDSIVSDNHWVCEKRFMVGYWVWSLFLGCFVGFFLNVNFISSFGRKTIITFFVGLSGISYILAGLSENQELLFLYLFLGGFGFMQFSMTMNNYLNEIIVNESYQQFSYITISIIWALGQIAINYISYFVLNWRYILIFCIGLPLIICLILIAKLIRESPYYLIAQQKYIDARKALTYIKNYNNLRLKGKLLLEGEQDYLKQYGYHLPEQEEKILQELTDKKLKNQIDRENYSILDLLRQQYQRLSILLLLLWIYQQLTYFASVYSLGFYGKDVHFNYLAIGIAEVVACFVGGPMKGLQKSYYKWILLLLISITVASQLTIYYKPVPYDCFTTEGKCMEEKIATIAAIANKFSICLYGIILKFYTAEAYPFFLSSSASNLGTIGGGVVGLFLPFVIASCSKIMYNPLGTIGWYGLGAILLTFFLEDLNLEQANLTQYDKKIYIQNEEMQEFQSKIMSPTPQRDEKEVPLISQIQNQ